MYGRLSLFAAILGLGVGAFPLTGYATSGSMTMDRFIQYTAFCKISYTAYNTQVGGAYVFYYKLQSSAVSPGYSGNPAGYKSEMFTGQGNSPSGQSGFVPRLYETWGYKSGNKAYLGWALVNLNTNATIQQGWTPNNCK